MNPRIDQGNRKATFIRRAGQMCLVVSLLGAAWGVYLAVVKPSVSEDQWSYPQSPEAFTFAQIWFGLQDIVLLFALLALWWTGAVGKGRLGRLGHYVAVVSLLGFAATELAAITAAQDSSNTPRVAALGLMYG